VDEQTYADLEGSSGRQLPLFPSKKLTKHEMLEVLRLQAEATQQQAKLLDKLLRRVLGPPQLSGRDQEERRLRKMAREVVQEELFEYAAEPVVRKKADRPERHPRARMYTPSEFDPKIRGVLRRLRDPREFDKVTNRRVATLLHLSQGNLWSLLKDYEYARPGETLARCLRRLADEWQNAQSAQTAEH